MFSLRHARPALSILASGLLVSLPLAAQTTPQPKTAATVHRRVAPAAPPLPKNIPPVKGPLKSAFALRYQDITVGTGDPAQPGQIYTVNYTGWLASDGTKFDSSYDHGKPFDFAQGRRSVIIGWDEGFDGMRVGGKRRLFVPYQLAYGANGRGPIPAKADLIFDEELVGVRDLNAFAPVAPQVQTAPHPATQQPPAATPPPATHPQ
jgi:peptidylprolyl isomerase